MARQKGIIKVKGSLGGVTFYESGGEDLARETGGVARERILRDPAFKRTRENMAEFGGSATVGKALRLGLAAVAKAFGDRKYVARLVGIMKAINARGAGLRGQRSFDVVANKDLIQGFEFNAKDVLASVFNASYSMTTNAQHNEVTVTVPDFDTDAFVNAPEGATHFRLVCAIGSLSDYTYAAGPRRYEPMFVSENSLGAVDVSGEITLGGMVGATTTLNPQLPGSPTLPAAVALVGCLGIEFVQELNSQFYLLASGNAMRIADVF
jgi:hypothetical protein